MQERLRSLADNIKEKIRPVATIVILLTTLVAAVFITSRPKRVVLMAKLDWIAASEIQTALNDANIYNRLAQNGTAVEVYQKDAAIAGVTLSSKNVPSGVGFTYEDALSYSDMETTEAIKKENLKQVKQSELSRNLVLYDGVTSAIVTLYIPEEDNFSSESNKKASAGVVLNVDHILDKKEGTDMALYLSGNVNGLDMDSIEIYDQNANTVYSGSEYE